MGNDWDIALHSLSKLTIHSNLDNEPVKIEGGESNEDLKCIGKGTDAAVFQHVHVPYYAFKIYAEEKMDKVNIEVNVYRQLGESPYFPICFATFENILVLSYEEGITLFDCLLQGIHIPQQVIDDVEEARHYVRSKGLNPRDIHLKNILLQNGRAKILDVSEYVHQGNDYRWEYLKRGYEQYYPYIDGNPVPLWLAESVRKFYNQHFRGLPPDHDYLKLIRKFIFRK